MVDVEVPFQLIHNVNLATQQADFTFLKHIGDTLVGWRGDDAVFGHAEYTRLCQARQEVLFAGKEVSNIGLGEQTSLGLL